MATKAARGKKRPAGGARASRAKATRKKTGGGAGRASARSARLVLLVGTKKGAFLLHGDGGRKAWRIEGPQFLGNEVNHIVLDPRDGRTLLMAAKTGHLGPTVFRSKDWGKTWKEAARPPAFPKVEEPDKGLAIDRVFWLSAGHASQPGVWWAGSVPHGMFRSDDCGETWDPVDGFNDYIARLSAGSETALGETPGGRITHSIRIDPRNASHMYVGLSTGGFFESTDGAATWRPLNKGCDADFIPTPNPEVGHDPHCAVMHPSNPDRLYQQNHCGVYRMDRAEGEWIRIGRNMPKAVGDIGFPVAVHPRDPDTVWVFPMDGTEVWPRTSPGGKPAVFMSRNAGRTWKRMAAGLPPSQGWFTVFRQALATDTLDPVGLYFGTTAGEIWMSRDEATRWTRIVDYLPAILSVETAMR